MLIPPLSSCSRAGPERGGRLRQRPHAVRVQRVLWMSVPHWHRTFLHAWEHRVPAAEPRHRVHEEGRRCAVQLQTAVGEWAETRGAWSRDRSLSAFLIPLFPVRFLRRRPVSWKSSGACRFTSMNPPRMNWPESVSKSSSRSIWRSSTPSFRTSWTLTRTKVTVSFVSTRFGLFGVVGSPAGWERHCDADSEIFLQLWTPMHA